MSKGKVVLGTLAGFAVGAMVGILFAPEKGSVTRKQIMTKGDDYWGDFKANFDGFIESMQTKYEATKSDVKDVAEKGKAKYDEVRKDLKNAASDATQSIL